MSKRHEKAVDRWPWWAHVYASHAWHQEAYIVGTREALARIHDALGRALKSGNAYTELFAGDGEGYNLIVMAVKADELQQMTMPYVADYAQDKREDVPGPDGLAIERGIWKAIAKEESANAT